jgi:hypothetical protein
MRKRNNAEEHPGRVGFVRNGVPDGYVVRLVNMEEKHFPTATRIEEEPNGSIGVYFDWHHIAYYSKGRYLSYWPVQKERPRGGVGPRERKLEFLHRV